jgi:hypothetical protein
MTGIAVPWNGKSAFLEHVGRDHMVALGEHIEEPDQTQSLSENNY